MQYLCFDFSFDGGRLSFRAIDSVIFDGSVKPCSARSEDRLKMTSAFEPRGLHAMWRQFARAEAQAL